MQAEWTVPADHPAFPGHFPGHPIVPGVVLLDRAVLLAAELTGQATETLRIGNAKFLSPAGPGEALRFAFTPSAGGLQFTIRAPDRDIAAGSLSFRSA